MKTFALIALLSLTNVWAVETTCNADQVKLRVIDLLKEVAHYNEDGNKITIENVKLGAAIPYPDFEHPTSYYISATMKMEMTSSEGSFLNENGILTFWFDATTCEETTTVFDELKPVDLEN